MNIHPEIRQEFNEMLLETGLSPEQIRNRLLAKHMAESKPLNFKKPLGFERLFVDCECLGYEHYRDCEGHWETVFYEIKDIPMQNGSTMKNFLDDVFGGY